MALILDAYNVLHCTHVLPLRYASINTLQLAAMLDRCNFDRGRMVIVCDGRPKPDELDPRIDVGRVEIIHSGAATDADTIIEQLIETETGPRDLTVVSNDHRIQRAARRRRATAMASEAFLRKLVSRFDRYAARKLDKTKPDLDADADTWMRKFGIDEKGIKPPANLEAETDRWMREFGYEDED
ncbi:hypothetical protein HED60_16295 [Planctomycetales bacterium ZRK34]|nr:hypothetical protein HED60_16295 [Planctomycetales bacterium ZRK34]